MKKIITIMLVLVLTLTAFAGCGNKEASATVYGTTNNCPAQATITVDAKGNVLSAQIEECVAIDYYTDFGTASDEDVVAVEVEAWGQVMTKRFYKEIKVGTTTFAFDENSKAYVSNGTTFAEWSSNEANVKAYYEALEQGKVGVTLNGEQDYSIYTVDTVYKSRNKYWLDDSGNSLWKKYADGTTNYIIENGFENAHTLKAGGDKVFTDAQSVSTGATWVCMPEYITMLDRAYSQALKNIKG